MTRSPRVLTHVLYQLDVLLLSSRCFTSFISFIIGMSSALRLCTSFMCSCMENPVEFKQILKKRGNSTLVMTRRWTFAAGLMSGKTTKRSSSNKMFAGASFATILQHNCERWRHQSIPSHPKGKDTDLQKIQEEEEAILLTGATRRVLLTRNINRVSGINMSK